MDKKYLYLPEANSKEKTEEASEIKGEYPCSCCGCITLPVPANEAIAYICPVCFWENDVFIKGENEPSDENGGITLNEAKENYKKFGACRKSVLKYAKKPKPEELNGI